jgi:hypothetical protein
MTTPTPTNPDKITASELRTALGNLHAHLCQLDERLDGISEDLALLREGLAAAASQPAATSAAAGQTVEFMATVLLVGIDDNGQPTYKAKGGQYAKFGVRIWPETLPILGIDPAELKPGPNPVNLHVLALMGDKGPRKVIALAK